jgi:uncharacterized protein (DUF486 family)
MAAAIVCKCDRGAAARRDAVDLAKLRRARIFSLSHDEVQRSLPASTEPRTTWTVGPIGDIAARAISPLKRPARQVLMPTAIISPYVSTVLLLIGSNAFMTTAWYWHLRYKEVPLWQVVLISWGLAFVEYCLAVPANRFGSSVYSAAQLKTIQEVVTLTVFGVFSYVYLQQAITWNQVIGFALIAGGAFFVFRAPL